MKHKGSRFEDRRQFDEELLSAFERIRKSHPSLPVREKVRKLVSSPASRFWVSEDRARIVVSALIRGKKPQRMIRCRLAMFEEIKRRVLAVLRNNRRMSLRSAVRSVVHQPAPCFYLTPASACVILCRARRRAIFEYD